MTTDARKGSEPTGEGATLWRPPAARARDSEIARYRTWLATERGLRFGGYAELQRWSVEHLSDFWSSIWEFFELGPRRGPTLADARMPGARWFPDERLSYAERALAGRDRQALALISCDEQGERERVSYGRLSTLVARAAAGLRQLGVRCGDRVAGLLPNGSEAVVAFLAAASLGATWSSCPPEFGVPSVLDRWRQIAPRVLLAADGYRYNGRPHDRRQAVAEIAAGLPGLQALVAVSRLDAPLPAGLAPTQLGWRDLLDSGAGAAFAAEPLPFDHPLWVLYSSGTTGLPKPIVHGHGGIVVEHLKALALHGDLRAGSRFFWHTTTGWMMWNFLVGGLLVGATIVLYDGSPRHPDLTALWRLAERYQLGYLGTSASHLLACRKARIAPGAALDLAALHTVGSTGSPLPPDGFAWVYRAVKEDLLLASVSGGTDICTPFVISCPLLPVRAGEIQCRALGADVQAFDENGAPLVGELGELVVTRPLPSMPVRFWNDQRGERLRQSYFARYPGVWHHGDWIKLTEEGSCVVYGRSDATLNRGGVRIGTSEFYSAIDQLPEVEDALVVDTSGGGREGKLFLFVVLASQRTLDGALRRRIDETLRRALSPRHVPDEVHAVAAIPYTLSGKRVEVPIKRILAGEPPERCLNPDTLTDPATVAPFIALARRLAG